jgi:MoxR-like ATPase
MTPSELKTYLIRLVERENRLSLMIWGPPGIGKSSIVAQVAQARGLDFIDLRLSQLAPTDLRGLPVPENGLARWYPPEFLPRAGSGILFLDELNMAPPALQGIAQQLVLDRRVGAYTVPDGWFIWAAGNRKEDRAAIFEMPSPLANRFLHLEVLPDFEAFKDYALLRSFDERLLAFLSFRPTLLHKQDAHAPAWPSPRSWEMANRLLRDDLEIAPAVGSGAASEFQTYIGLYASLPDMAPILEGRGAGISFPEEPSARYALSIGLTIRAQNVEQLHNAFAWLVERAAPEWVQLFAADVVRLIRARGQMGQLAQLVARDKRLRAFLKEYQELVSI